ncbi:MAG: hypothetical protein ACYCOU_03485 [Sulfobacillus sp.]
MHPDVGEAKKRNKVPLRCFSHFAKDGMPPLIGIETSVQRRNYVNARAICLGDVSMTFDKPKLENLALPNFTNPKLENLALPNFTNPKLEKFGSAKFYKPKPKLEKFDIAKFYKPKPKLEKFGTAKFYKPKPNFR